VNTPLVFFKESNRLARSQGPLYERKPEENAQTLDLLICIAIAPRFIKSLPSHIQDADGSNWDSWWSRELSPRVLIGRQVDRQQLSICKQSTRLLHFPAISEVALAVCS
jgi:hypothetical protein